MTRHKLLAMRASEPDKALEVFSRKSTARCKEWCSCACHKKNILRVKELSTIGSFSLAYSGLPWLTAACDQKTCRSRSVPSVAVTFNFPPWVWHRYFSSSFSYTPIRGPEINFKLPRMVDWSSRLWRCGVVGDIGGVQKLYSSGTASPWDVNTLGGSLLHYATDHEHWDLCHFLVREGVTTETEDDFTNSPVSIVWQKILSRTLTGDESSRMAGLFSDTDYLETRQFTILHKIVLDLIPRTLESELEFSTKDLDSVDSSGRTCASWAAARGDSETMGTLLRYGANVNICDGQGASPLHHATSVACINLLVNSGADVNARNSFGHTPLHSICRGSGSLLLLQHLVAIGIDINLADRSGETALANATFNGHTACALYLLEIGADMDLAGGPNMSGDGPVQLAVSQNMHEVLHCLLDGGVAYTRANLTGSTVLHLAARFADAGTVGILKRHGLDSIDASHLDYDGKTARDYIEEREEDAESAIFKPVFEELLQGIEKGRHNELASVHSLETRLAALDTLKSTAIATSTPVSSEDEDYDQEFADDECGHNPPIFFDAIESLLELPPTAEIKV